MAATTFSNLSMATSRPQIPSSQRFANKGPAILGGRFKFGSCDKLASVSHVASARPFHHGLISCASTVKFDKIITKAMSESSSNNQVTGLPIDLRGKRAFIAGVADDNGYGWAIAKSLAAAGAEILVGTWVPALNIFESSLRRGKFDESRIRRIYDCTPSGYDSPRSASTSEPKLLHSSRLPSPSLCEVPPIDELVQPPTPLNQTPWERNPEVHYIFAPLFFLVFFYFNMPSPNSHRRGRLSVERPSSCHGHNAMAPTPLRRPKTDPDLLSYRNHAGSPPEGLPRQPPKLLLKVTVLGSLGPVQVLMRPESTVGELVAAVARQYVKEARRPILPTNDASDFDLHYSQFSLESLHREEKLVELGSRNFFMCPRKKLAATTPAAVEGGGVTLTTAFASCAKEAGKGSGRDGGGFGWLKLLRFML